MCGSAQVEDLSLWNLHTMSKQMSRYQWQAVPPLQIAFALWHGKVYRIPHLFPRFKILYKSCCITSCQWEKIWWRKKCLLTIFVICLAQATKQLNICFQIALSLVLYGMVRCPFSSWTRMCLTVLHHHGSFGWREKVQGQLIKHRLSLWNLFFGKYKELEIIKSTKILMQLVQMLRKKMQWAHIKWMHSLGKNQKAQSTHVVQEDIARQ